MSTYYSPTMTDGVPMLTRASDRARLILNVPADAVVYMGDQRMTLTGTSREYLVPGLESGKQYRYAVRVEVVRDGTVYRADSVQQIQAGQRLDLVFSPGPDQPQLVGMRD